MAATTAGNIPNIDKPKEATSKTKFDPADWKNIPESKANPSQQIGQQAQVTPGQTPDATKIGPTSMPGYTPIAGGDVTSAEAQLGKDMYRKLAGEIDVGLKGEIPADVAEKIRKEANEQGFSKGMYGKMTNAEIVKQMGLTSRDIHDKAVEQGMKFAELGEKMREYDTTMANKVASFNAEQKQDLEKHIATLDTNKEISNADRADKMAQFKADSMQRAQEFNIKTNQERLLKNAEMENQINIANATIKSETDRAAANNYMTATIAAMNASNAMAQFNAQQEMLWKTTNAEIGYRNKQLDLAEKELKLTHEDAVADRLVKQIAVLQDNYQFEQELAFNYATTKANGKNVSKQWTTSFDDFREKMKKMFGLKDF